MVHAGMGVRGPARPMRQALATRLPLRSRSLLAALCHFQAVEIITFSAFCEALTLVYYGAFPGSIVGEGRADRAKRIAQKLEKLEKPNTLQERRVCDSVGRLRPTPTNEPMVPEPTARSM